MACCTASRRWRRRRWRRHRHRRKRKWGWLQLGVLGMFWYTWEFWNPRLGPLTPRECFRSRADVANWFVGLVGGRGPRCTMHHAAGRRIERQERGAGRRWPCRHRRQERGPREHDRRCWCCRKQGRRRQNPIEGRQRLTCWSPAQGRRWQLSIELGQGRWRGGGPSHGGGAL